MPDKEKLSAQALVLKSRLELLSIVFILRAFHGIELSPRASATKGSGLDTSLGDRVGLACEVLNR